MGAWIDVWMDGHGWAAEWTDGCIGARIDGWIDGCANGSQMWVEGWMDGWMDGGMEGWAGGRTDGWIEGWPSCSADLLAVSTRTGWTNGRRTDRCLKLRVHGRQTDRWTGRMDGSMGFGSDGSCMDRLTDGWLKDSSRWRDHGSTDGCNTLTMPIAMVTTTMMMTTMTITFSFGRYGTSTCIVNTAKGIYADNITLAFSMAWGRFFGVCFQHGLGPVWLGA